VVLRGDLLAAPAHTVVLPNGTTADLDGTLIIRDQGGRVDAVRLSRLDPRTDQISTVMA
jgi:hypothetical protein